VETLFQPLPTSPARTKVVGTADAVQLVHEGDCVVIGGFGGIGFAEALILALERRFVDTGSPRDLTLVMCVCAGDLQASRGVDHLAHEGLVKRVISGHWGFAPKFQKLAVTNQIEAYNLPLGCIAQLFRDIAAGRPGLISRVGLDTFVDPRHGGGKVNARTTDDLVNLITVKGQEYLFYSTFPTNIALLRGTTADSEGNVTLEREALTLEALAIASAVHNSGGLVIVQVERLAEAGSLRSRDVEIPAALVDCVVLAPREHHWQTMGTHYSPAFSGEVRVTMRSIPPLPLNDRKVIARRAAFELKPNSVVNLGVGMPEGIASVANEEHVLKYVTLTAEPGVIGGMPASGLNFGAAVNAQAIIDQPAQFDFYDGGGLDAAFLGMAQVDREGNVNVSRFGPRLPGAGGFINISQNAKRLIFVGTFTAQGQSWVQDNRLVTKNDGAQPKFVHEVEQGTFSGPVAAASGRSVLYVTERCVFRLVPEGLELCEIAPGVDIERDVLAFMGFEPIMQAHPKLMDARIFRPWLMGLKDHLLALPMAARFRYDPDGKLFFVNLEGLVLSTRADLEALRTEMVTRLEAIGEKVHVIANYDYFLIVPDLVDAFMDGIRDLAERYYDRVSRYSTSSFMRLTLGDALQSRGLAPHIFENWEEIVGRIRAS